MLDLDFEEEEELLDVSVDLPLGEGFGDRPYQKEAVEAFEAAIKDGHSKIALVMATGVGKTIVSSRIIQKWVKAGKRLLFLADRDTLVWQTAKKLEKCAGMIADIEKGQDRASLHSPIVVASVQTLSRVDRLMSFPDRHFDLVFYDECHGILSVTGLRTVNYFHYGERSLDEGWQAPEPDQKYERGAIVLGLTATFERGDKKNLGQFFTSVPYVYGMKEAVLDGYLVRPVFENIPLKIDLKGVKMSGQDYSAQEVDDRLKPLLAEIARSIKEHAGNLKVAVFTPSVDSAIRLAEALRDAGMDAISVHGEDPQREAKLEFFDAAPGGTAIVSPMMLTTGWDCVSVDCICNLRPTKLWGLLMQIIGRGLRILPKIIDGLDTPEERRAAIAQSAKPICKILDFLWVTDRANVMKAVDLIVSRPDLKKQMEENAAAAGGEVIDLLGLELTATRDLLKSLEKAAREAANRKAKVVDPLAFNTAIGDEKGALYQPETDWEKLPPTDGQIDFLHKQHIDTTKVTCRGQARQLTLAVLDRLKIRLATPLQLNFLKSLGAKDEDHIANLTIEQASILTNRILAEKKKREADRRAGITA